MSTCRGCGSQLDSGIFSCPHCGGTALHRTVHSAPQPLFTPGTVLDSRYRVEQYLGSGASGAVYGVTDTRLERTLALKMFWESCLPDDPAFERSRREALAGQKTESPYLVHVHDLLLIDGHPALLMDWVEGETLRQRILRGGPLPGPDACRIAADLLRALSALHDKGIVHRDVKSGNILLGEGNSTKLGDLGLAKGSDLGQTLTADQAVLGTPGYIAPEVLQGGRATPASDLYSAGVVLFESLAGAPPFESSSAHETLSRALKEPPPLAQLREKGVPRWLVRLVARLLEKDPKDRYPNAQAVLAALERNAAGFFVTHRWRKRGLTAALLLAGIGATLWALKPWEENRFASSLRVSGEVVDGLSKDGGILWQVPLTGPIQAAKGLESNPAQANRFFVVHGGYSETKTTKRDRPRLAILSATGSILAHMDLLSKFNPYRKDFLDDFYMPKLRLEGDFDKDGYRDLIVGCRHAYYPEILYFFSGKERDIIGGYANSGHISTLAQTPWDFNTSSGLLCALAMNNRMGHQCCLFLFPFTSTWNTSPDLAANPLLDSSSYRPLGSGPYDMGAVRFLPNGEQMEVRFGERRWTFNSGLCREGEPCFSDFNQAGGVNRRRCETYNAIRTARETLRRGSAEEALGLYREASAQAPDENLQFYALTDGLREFREAGRPDLALAFFPQTPDKTANPGDLMFQRAELLSLLGRHQEAARLFLATSEAPSLQPWYSFPGYVRSRILSGADTVSLYRECQRYFPEQADSPAGHAWCLIPGLLRGKLSQAERDLARAVPPGPTSSSQRHVLFQQEKEFWQALFDLELGRPRTAWPDESAPETMHEPALKLKIAFLKAWRLYKEGKKAEAQPLLEKVHEDLQEAARREPEAILPLKMCERAMKTM